MDPYIEAYGLWEDFHDDLISEIKRSLARTAPARYLVRTGKRSYVVLVAEEGKDEHRFVPDVRITTGQAVKRSPRKKSGTAVATLEPETKSMRLRMLIEDQHREAYIEIREATPEQRLITALEVLSPSNKRPNTPGWHEYLRKRQSVVLDGVNLVEIDLLRGGQRLPMLDPWPECPYTLLVARPNKKRLCDVWPASFQSRLPIIPVPLAPPDPDLTLDLQPMVAEIYERSRYEQSIDYSQALSPLLEGEEAAWWEQQRRAQQKPG
jgi:hypothetical protein